MAYTPFFDRYRNSANSQAFESINEKILKNEEDINGIKNDVSSLKESLSSDIVHAKFPSAFLVSSATEYTTYVDKQGNPVDQSNPDAIITFFGDKLIEELKGIHSEITTIKANFESLKDRVNKLETKK